MSTPADELRLALRLMPVGAVIGILLTVLGKWYAEAPPASVMQYVWNAAIFAVLAMMFGPVAQWVAARLRRTP